jgi:hypothetical protein
MAQREDSEAVLEAALRALAAGATPITQLTVSQRALRLAVQPGRTLRSSDEEPEEFVVYDASSGEPPRQVIVTVRPLEAGDWELQVRSDPAASGALLVSVGVKSYASRFDSAGAALIKRITAEVIVEAAEQDVNIAIIPL